MGAPTSELGYATSHAGSWWAAPQDEETPEVRWPESVRVYGAMHRQDTQVRSVMRAVTLPVRRTTWRIDPNGARDEVVEHVAADLGLPIVGVDESDRPRGRTRDRFSWSQHLADALLSLRYGHSVMEQVGRLDDRGRVRLRKLALRPARTISAWDVARDGGLNAIEQYGGMDGTGAWGATRIPISRLVVYSHEREDADWTGNSLLRPAYKNWLIKDRLLRVWAQTIDRNGMGIPVYEDAAGNKFMEDGRKIAAGYRSGENSHAAIPNGAKLRLQGVEGALPDAEPAIRYHDEQIARGVLAHALNLGQQTGSWALGTTFMDFFTLSLQTVADWLRDTANEHVVEDLVDWNWGIDENAPRIVCDEIGSRHPATAAAIKMLLDAGALSFDPALERHLRQQYGLPAADDSARPPAGDPGGTDA
jgi:hypothetical protein